MRPRGTSKDVAQLPSLYHPMASSSSVAIVVNPFEDSQSDVQPSLTQRRPVAPRMRSNLLPISLSNSTDPATLRELDVPKPWVQNPNFRARISYWIVYVMILVGLALGVIQCYLTYKNVMLDRQDLCLVMEEQFDGTEDDVFGPNGYFMREVDASGSGNGQFEMTTSSSKNSYIKDGMLYLVPTLTEDVIGEGNVFDGYVYNLTDCTFNVTQPNNGYIITGDGTTVGSRNFDYAGYYHACSAASNSSAGTVINPVQSARVSTLLSARGDRGGSIRYGRIEVRAKMPTGDWMWPAIWLLPKDNVYGDWPRSGEIDMVESRGNGIRYTARGSNYVQGSLNWGPSPALNSVDKSFSWWTFRRESFSSQMHTYVLEWTDEFIRIYVDTRAHTLLSFKFKKSFWELGDFPGTITTDGHQVPLENIWANGTFLSAPFDQEFYLIMNVAVGSTGGWFPDGQGNKPWLNSAGTAMRDFARAKELWYPTWPQNLDDRAMVVDYVRMYKHCSGS